MHSRSNRTKLAYIGIFLTGIATGVLATPLWRYGVREAAQSQFARLTYACDSAMREQLIAKQQLALRPNKDNVKSLRASEIALVDCQDYDLLRKRLIWLGLTDNDLSLMGLNAIEARKDTLPKVVGIHEIRY